MFSHFTDILSYFQNHLKVFLLVLIVSITTLQFSSTIVEDIRKPMVELIDFDSNTDTENKELTEVVPSDEMLTYQKNEYSFQSQLEAIDRHLFVYISQFNPIESPPPEV